MTDGDLRRALINSLEVEKVKVKEIFSRKALTVRTNNNLREAISSLESGRKNPISAAPVVDASEVVVGIVTIHLLTQVGVS